MTDGLDLHPASADERAQAFRNVHDVWPWAEDPDEHTARRLADPKFGNATCYVGTLDGRVVTSCGCYHVSLCIDGAVEPTCAIGAVHTLPAFRGRGFAPRLIAFAESQAQRAGKTIGLLFSDIAPAYYERLGYRICRAAHGWINPSERPTPRPTTGRLVRFQPADELHELRDLYERAHAGLALSVARSPEYWRYLISQRPEEEFYFIELGGRRAGYMRLGNRRHGFVIRDLVCGDNSDEARRALYAAAIARAQELGIARVGGWMPDDSISREFFEVSDRVQELTMVKPFVERIKIDERHRVAAEHLHEIDHV
jgi:predicted acetyltransferase